MSAVPGNLGLPPDHREALARAVRLLERPSFAVKIADIAGLPVTRVLGALPGAAHRGLSKMLEAALFKCLEVAIQSLDGTPRRRPSRWLSKVVTGAAGGMSGVFGMAALPIELPLTTMFMLRSIAEIARHEGEDLKRLETGLACLEVFALGDGRSVKRGDVGYYATRAVLTQLTAEVAAVAAQRGTIDAAAPVVSRMVGEIAGHFGVAVSERAAASALPIIGALGGATVNVIFMDHFQRIAAGHFIIRRLERRYGSATVRALYQSHAERRPPTS